MATAEDPGTGSNDRATVALVAAEVREVKAIVAGNSDTTAAEFRGLRTVLGPLALLPVQVADLSARVTALERAAGWRLGTLPAVLIGVASLIMTIVTLVVTQ